MNNSKTTIAASAAAAKSANDPNVNFGMYEKDREAKRLAQPKLPTREVSVFGYYKGCLIEGIRAGHPQAQNVEIDGKPVGYVIFPTSVIAIGRRIIDARQKGGAQ